MTPISQWWTFAYPPNHFLPVQDDEAKSLDYLYGYKVLLMISPDLFISPSRPAVWRYGFARADREPDSGNMSGIYSVKSYQDGQLADYIIYAYSERPFLVRLALFGIVVEGEKGYRSEMAQITGVYDNGYWKSYQNTQEHPEEIPHDFSYETEIWHRYREKSRRWPQSSWNLRP